MKIDDIYKRAIDDIRRIMIKVERLESLYQKLDFVPVVRCKECKHRPSGTGANHDLEFPDGVCPCQCEDFWYSWKPNDDWFCASGERKKE